jgi:mono/diheme cytochrome c family protein
LLKIIFSITVLIILSACSIFSNQNIFHSGVQPGKTGMDGMMGPARGMMIGHHSSVPDTFAGMVNPVLPDDGSLARGGKIYTAHCANCHGDFGNGDGPGGTNLDPRPAPIAHTSQMMSDGYLFWRITEGGIPFETGMVPYKDILDETARWDVINFVRALGRGKIQQEPKVGGSPFDQEAELVKRAEMLATAVKTGILNQEDADTFDLVHSAMDEFSRNGTEISMGSNSERADALSQILDTLVVDGTITENQAVIFLAVHDRLVESGLME